MSGSEINFPCKQQLRNHSMMRVIVSMTLVLAIPGVLRGSIYVEVETSGTPNNTIAGAEAIPSANFTLPVPATVFDPPGWATATILGTASHEVGFNNDIDFYSFTTLGGGAMFDVDREDFFPSSDPILDPILSLFDSLGTFIGVAVTDSPQDPGSIGMSDPFLGIINLAPGTYFIAVSGNGVFPDAIAHFPSLILTPLVRPDGEDGGLAVSGAPPGLSSFVVENGPDGPTPYRLHISLENDAGRGAIPEPVSLAVWTLLGVLTAAVAFGLRDRHERHLLSCADSVQFNDAVVGSSPSLVKRFVVGLEELLQC
jgi:hypothetical protein